MAYIKFALLAALALQAVASPIESQDEKTLQPYKFEYGVNVPASPYSGGSSQQGHAEARVGDHSIGNYFVQLPEQGASTKVGYTTDLWGYHPVVSYSTKESHTRFAYGDRAVAAISNPAATGNLPVSIDSAAKVADFDVTETLGTLAAAGNPPIPGKLVQELEKAKGNLAAVHGHSGLAVAPAPIVAHQAPILAPPAPVIAHAPAVVATAAPYIHQAPVAVQPVAPAVVAQSLPIIQQQKLVKPIVVAEFNSNNHLLAQHAPVAAAPVVVSTTPAPFIASPTPAPILFSSPHPHPVVHPAGGFIASTAAPIPFSVTPKPFHFVSSTPQPSLVANIGAEIHHHALPAQQKEVVVVDRPVPVEVTKVVEKQVPVHVPVEVTKYVDRPVQVTKFIDRPVEVIKHVDRPVQVTKFVDRPVEVTKFVDRPVEVTKYVDRPVHVTKFVDRPVEVTKYVDRPVPVTKYVDRPYEVIKHVPVEKPVYVPGPTIEKHVPVPVTKYVDRPVPHPVAVPVQVTKAVPVPVPHPVPYAQYVLNVPYNGQYAYGRIKGADSFRSESYADAALKLDAWKADQVAYKGGLNGYRAEALLKPSVRISGYAGDYAGGYGASYGYAGGYGAGYTESADLKGFKVSKTLLAGAANIVPAPGPTKVTLTVEPHVLKTDAHGRTFCEGAFKPPLVPSRYLGAIDESW